MKKTLITAVAFGFPCGLAMGIFNSAIHWELNSRTIFTGIIGGLVMGVAFAITMKYLAKNLFKSISFELAEDEKLIKEGGANHIMGREGVGGKLVLTDKRLVFKSHKLNIQNHEQVFHFNDIQSLGEAKSLFILKNKLVLELLSKDLHKFIVDEPGVWVKEIELLRNA
ncbi:MAG TPA: GRAM domain-containing protein [Chryseolinea sp.]|nr:GRAM domain-containing protein [Chryseolinea sp.]HPH45606.1 GRAM domain-containing protein [Chryseolinea sp.]HPM31416.1 GRAM domain-containing protein [Chryseolinea sp.]